MLSKDKRLNLKTDFKWVASGEKIETAFVTLFIKSGSNTRSRLGIALSSKNFAKATDRNRAKRLVSAAFERIYDRLPDNLNIVALPKKGVIEVKSDELLVQLEPVLRNIVETEGNK